MKQLSAKENQALQSALAGFNSPISGAQFKAACPNVVAKLVGAAHPETDVLGTVSPIDVTSNIRVTFCGSGAFCRHRSWQYGRNLTINATINLPALDDARVLNRAEANRWLGYLIHETFHVILTDSPTWDAFCRGNKPFAGKMLNAVEDARIERDGIARGIAAGFLNVGYALIANLLATGGASANPNDPRQVPWMFAIALRGYGIEGEQRLLRRVHPSLWAIVEGAKAALAATDPLKSTTQDAVEITKWVMEQLRALADTNVEPEQEQGEGEPGEKGKGEPSKGGKPGKDKAESDETPREERENGDEADDAQPDEDYAFDEPEDGEGDDGEPGDDDGMTAGDDESDDDGEEGAGEPGDEDGEEGSQEGAGEPEGDGDDEGEGEGAGDGDDASGDDSDGDGADGKSEGGDEGAGDGYSPDAGGSLNPSDFKNLDSLKKDEVRDVEPDVKTDRDVEATKDEVQVGKCGEGAVPVDDTGYSIRLARRCLSEMTGLAATRTMIKRLFARTDFFSEERNLRRGRVVTSALYRVALGATDVFSRRTDADGEDVAVSIVIDCSGSMSSGMGWNRRRERKCQSAAKTALVIGECLSTTPGVKYEVLGFGAASGFDDDDETEGCGEASGSDYSKVGAGYAPVADGTMLAVFKSFAEPHVKFLRRFNVLYGCAQGGTPDLQALDGAAQRLAKQPAGRRLIIFITDGQGDGRFSTHRAALEKKFGFLTIGIGIGQGLAGRFDFEAEVYDVSMLATTTLKTIVTAVEKSGRV